MLHRTHLLDMEVLTRMAQRERSDVLASAAAGDEIAFQRLIAAHHDDMSRVCSYVTGDDAVAEEAAQAAWVIAWKRIGSVRDPASVRPWLISVAVNEAKQLIRREAQEDEDDRDRLIEMRGDQVGGYVLAVGALVALALAMVEVHYFWIANTILAGLVLSEIGKAIVMLSAYRRGL